MKQVAAILAASAILLSGCQKQEQKPKAEKKPVIQKTDSSPEKKPKKQEITSENVKQDTSVTLDLKPIYAENAEQPFDSLIYGTFTRKDKTPLEKATLKLKVFDSQNNKYNDYVTIPIPPNGHYKIAVSSKKNYEAVVNGDNITTSTGFIGTNSNSRSVKKSTSSDYKTELQFDGEFPEIGNIEGKIVDANGNPLPETFLSFAYANNDKINNLTSFRIDNTVTTSTQDGTFIIKKAPVGSGTLVVKAPDYMPITLENFNCPTSEPITIKVTKKGATLTGKVVQLDNGAPVENARIGLEQTISRENIGISSAIGKYLITKSDASGNFELKNIPPNAFTLITHKETPEMQIPAWLSKSNKTVQLNEGQTSDVQIILYPGHNAVGKVYDKESNEPLANAKVKKRYSQTESNIVTTADGTFRLPGIFSNQNIEVELEGYTTYENSIPLNPSNPKNFDIEVDIPMVQTVKVSGTVKTKEGTPISNAEITAATNFQDLHSEKKHELKPDGKYEVEVRPFSNFIIIAKAPNYAGKQSDQTEVGIEDIKDLDIILEPGITLAGQITDEEQHPLNQVRLNSQIDIKVSGGSSAISAQSVQSDLLGNFTINQLAKDGDVYIYHNNYVSKSIKVSDYNLSPGESKTGLKITLEKGFTISGTVKTDSGKIPQDINHLRFELNNNSTGASVDRNTGKFELNNLSNGSYLISDYSNRIKPVKVDAGTTGVQIIVPDTPTEAAADKANAGKTSNLTGTIVDKKTKQPITKYSLKIKPDAEKPVISSSNASQFTINGLTCGKTYDLIVTAPDFIGITIPFDVPQHQDAFEKQFELETGGSVSGIVLNKNDKAPIENAVIQIWPTNATESMSWFSQENSKPTAYTVTDNNGKFIVHGLKEGPIKLTVKPKSPLISVSQSTNITNDQNNDVGEILVNAGATIKGKFTNSKNQPFVGKKINLNGYSINARVSKNTTTDEKGEFEFTGLPDSSYGLSSETPTVYSHTEIKNSEDKTVTLSMGEITLIGKIDKRDDQIINSLSLTNPETKNSYSASFRGGSNTANIEGLAAGKYTYSISGRTGQYYSDVDSGDITIPEQKEVEHTFIAPKGRILGTLTDSDGKPVNGATVTKKLSEPTNGNNRNTYSDIKTQNDGTFTIDYLPTGTYTITATTRDKGKAVKSGVVVGQGDVEVKLSLSEKTGIVESLAVDAETGEPIREAWCYLTDDSGVRLRHNGIRDADGIMKITGVPEGEYNVEVSFWGFTSGNHRITVSPDKPVSLDDALYKAGALRWKILGSSGRPVAGVPVQVTAAGAKVASDNRTVTTDGNGEAVVRGLSQGTYTLTANKDGKFVTEEFVITTGQVTTKENTVKEW